MTESIPIFQLEISNTKYDLPYTKLVTLNQFHAESEAQAIADADPEHTWAWVTKWVDGKRIEANTYGRAAR
jgi:hypothetical protein